MTKQIKEKKVFAVETHDIFIIKIGRYYIKFGEIVREFLNEEEAYKALNETL